MIRAKGLRARVLAWSAWAPGVDTPSAWQAWAESPRPLEPDGHPEARFLPAMIRRRCSPLTRIMLTAAFGCVPEPERARVRTVFASRHGSVNESIGLLHAIVRGERISPAVFSHTVHNAQAGLYCMATGNQQASSSLAARRDTFGCGYLESLAHLEREPDRPVLYVIGDVGLAPTFADMLERPFGSYAVALLLGRRGEGPALALEIREAGESTELPWPDALEFLRWFLVPADAGPLALRRFSWSQSPA